LIAKKSGTRINKEDATWVIGKASTCHSERRKNKKKEGGSQFETLIAKNSGIRMNKEDAIHGYRQSIYLQHKEKKE
jgi:hypothetical protein